MKQIQVTDISTHGLTVPGGWYAHVPEILKVDDAYLAAFTPWFLRRGYNPGHAQDECLRRVQAMFEGQWIYALRKAIGRWAREYEKRFGDLEGFDPEYMSSAFVPAQQFGRAGNPAIGAMFAEMRRER
jgi:hypothetical protein